MSTAAAGAGAAGAARASAPASTRVVSSKAIHRIARRGRVDSLDLAELAGVIDIDNDDDHDHDHYNHDDVAVAAAAAAAADNDNSSSNKNNYNNNNVSFGPWKSHPNDGGDDVCNHHHENHHHLLICPRRQLNSPDVSARLTNWTSTTTSSFGGDDKNNNNNNNNTSFPSIQELFETLFPKDWMRQVLLVQTNQQLLLNNYNHTTTFIGNNNAVNNVVEMISYGEMLRFLGLWFLMATTHFEDVHDFWTTTTTTTTNNNNNNSNPLLFASDDGVGDVGGGGAGIPCIHLQPQRLDHLMSHARFSEILNALQYTATTTSTDNENIDDDNIDDPFWQVRQMLQAWNDNMSTQFMASWISCMDITMSPWIVHRPTTTTTVDDHHVHENENDIDDDNNSNDDDNERYNYEYSLCPGFKCVPCMQSGPLLLGNKYHAICCAKSGIMYRVELDEGKDALAVVVATAAPAGAAVASTTPTTTAAAAAAVVVKEFDDQGNNKTIGTWLRLAKPLFGSAKVVVLGRNMMSSAASGGGSDCLVQGLMELKKRGVFGTALIQKRQSASSSSSLSLSWPNHICGIDIMLHFADKDVGHADSLPGTFRGQSFYVACVKERPLAHHHHHNDDSSTCSICCSDNNVTMLLSTYGTMERGGETKTRHYHEQNGTKRTKTFQYPQVIQNHIQYQDTVELHNLARMHPISLEAETWKKATTRWPNRVFQFLLAVTEVNCRLAMEMIFCSSNNNNNGQKKKKYSQQEFRKLLAKSLIYNTHLVAAAETNHRNNNHHYEQQQQQQQPRGDDDDDDPSISLQDRITAETAAAAAAGAASTTTTATTGAGVHRLVQIPRYRTFRGESLVKVKTRYAQRLCKCKKSRLRSYCQCTPGLYLCTQCFAEHITTTMHNNNHNNNNHSNSLL